MFAHDTLHDEWVSRCAEYLVSVFGVERLSGATVLDYAFGRGNWSLAFLKAGASRVVAIDAAESNVLRFSAYCRENAIQGVEIRLGNILDKELGEKFDVIWLYGILHHIEQRQLFIDRVADCLADDTSEVMIYAYNADCLRQRVVSAARSGVVYRDVAAFEGDALLFNPLARIRARDDLTAPWIDWYSSRDFKLILDGASLVSTRTVKTFSSFLGASEAPEFLPHHAVCRRAVGESVAEYPVDDTHYGLDHRVIGDLSDWIVSQAGDERKNFSIGLFNTHFPALRHCGYAECISEDFRFLLYCWRKLDLNMPDDPILSMYLESGAAATAGRRRSFTDDVLRQSKLARFISENAIRL